MCDVEELSAPPREDQAFIETDHIVKRGRETLLRLATFSRMKIFVFVTIFLSVTLCPDCQALPLQSSGGCLAKNTKIPTISAGEVEDLSARIKDILNGNSESKKLFMNREECLPAEGSSPYYSEYRLYPNVADANRIVVLETNKIFYFTRDHYSTFFQIIVPLQSSGGCLAKNTKIPTISAGEVENLRSRINDIINGDIHSRKRFMNREKCLPQPSTTDYSEYRLYPNVADANRIVVLGTYQVFYFTMDHYTTFFQIENSNFFGFNNEFQT